MHKVLSDPRPRAAPSSNGYNTAWVIGSPLGSY